MKKLVLLFALCALFACEKESSYYFHQVKINHFITEPARNDTIYVEWIQTGLSEKEAADVVQNRTYYKLYHIRPIYPQIKEMDVYIESKCTYKKID